MLQTEEGLHISGRVHHREVKLCRKLPRELGLAASGAPQADGKREARWHHRMLERAWPRPAAPQLRPARGAVGGLREERCRVGRQVRGDCRQERHARHLVEPPHQQAFEPEAALEL